MSVATRQGVEVVLPARVDPDGFVVRAQRLGPVPPGKVRLRMEATGVSFAEQQMRRGAYFDQPPFPFVPGYDLVGVATAAGSDEDAALVGRRFAAVTKIGAWASFVDVPTSDLLSVSVDHDASVIESLIVNGIAAWQMLHDTARVAPPSTIVVLGANGGVGTTLVQLARHAGIRVIGTAAQRHHDLIRKLGAADVVDSHDPDVYRRLRQILPGGADAVFDHVGGRGLRESWRLLRRGGTLVSYGSAATKNTAGDARLPIFRSAARVLWWNALPNGRSARLYNLWAGHGRDHFIPRQQAALTRVLALVSDGALAPQVAARIPLTDIARAVEIAESRTVVGKVIVTAVETDSSMNAAVSS